MPHDLSNGAATAVRPVNSTPNSHLIPRLPVLGWASFGGARRAKLPSVLQNPHVLFTTSGRAAIALALQALAVAPRDRVLVPSFHCPTMIAPVVSTGAEPVFYPITEAGSVDIDYLQRLDLGRVRAILAAHYFGLPQPMSRLRRFCDEHGIALIEDCAHAFFGTSEGKPIGGWGDFAIASLTKFFPVSEGGCLVSATRPLDGFVLESRPFIHQLKTLASAVEIGTTHGRFPGLNWLLRFAFELERIVRRRRADAPAEMRNEGDDDGEPGYEYDESIIGSRITRGTQWIVTLVHRERIVALRRRNYMLLADLLADAPNATPHLGDLPEGAVPYVFPLRVQHPDPRYQALRAARVPLFRWDQVWPGTPSIRGDQGLAWSHEIFQLGCHQDMTEADVHALADTVRRVFAEVS